MSKNVLLKRYFDLSGQEFNPEDTKIKKSLRVNILKISIENLVERLESKGVRLKKIPFLTNSFWYEADFPLSSTEEYLLGFFYIQEPASQIPPIILIDDDAKQRIKKGIEENKPLIILDMASAPGSKTTQLVELSEDKTPIVAIDSVAPRLDILNNNLDRMGCRSVITYRKDARYADDLEQDFDFILLDAPCSGNYCIEKNYFSKRRTSDFRKQSIVQKELLRTAHRILKQNGVLVYSTCSLEPEENEEVIDWFIKEFSDMELEKINFPVGDDGLTKIYDKELSPELSKTKRFWPHKTGTQGFFIARMRKKEKK
jgi:NOL1/NOP2/sun family putative RNA methylase